MGATLSGGFACAGRQAWGHFLEGGMGETALKAGVRLPPATLAAGRPCCSTGVPGGAPPTGRRRACGPAAPQHMGHPSSGQGVPGVSPGGQGGPGTPAGDGQGAQRNSGTAESESEAPRQSDATALLRAAHGRGERQDRSATTDVSHAVTHSVSGVFPSSSLIPCTPC